MSVPYRPLGTVKEMLEQIGMEVSYAYEDLVFLAHNRFLLQFGKVGEVVFFYANIETPVDEAGRLFGQVVSAAAQHGLAVLQRGGYRISAEEGERLNLEFLASDTPESPGGGLNGA